MEYEQPDVLPALRRELDDEEDKRARQARIAAEREIAQREGKRVADEQEAAGRRALTRPLSSYTPGNMTWLWDGRIPIGEITMLAGKAGIGKSTVMSTWAAWLSLGKMRGAYYGNPSHVIYVPNEDSVEKALLPRLMASNADLDRIHTLSITNTTDDDSVPLVLPEDCERMAIAARETGAVAVFLDPLSSNMSDKDRNRPEVRQSYERLRRCAEMNSLAIIGNGHLKKGASADLLEGILGSSEIGNIVRAAMGVILDPDCEERQMILSQCKNNYGPMGLKSYVYRIAEKVMWTEYGSIKGTHIEWQESTERQVNDLMAEGMVNGNASKDAIKEAEEFIRAYLTDEGGQAERGKVIFAGNKDGHARPTLDRAFKRMDDVQSVPSGRGASKLWVLFTQSSQA